MSDDHEDSPAISDLDAFEAATPDHGIMAVGKRKRKGDTPSEWTPRIRRASSQVVTEKDLQVKMVDRFHEKTIRLLVCQDHKPRSPRHGVIQKDLRRMTL